MINLRFSSLIPVVNTPEGVKFQDEVEARKLIAQEYPDDKKAMGIEEAVFEKKGPEGRQIWVVILKNGFRILGIIYQNNLHIGRDFTRAAFDGLYRLAEWTAPESSGPVS